MSLETNISQIHQNIPTDRQHDTVLAYLSQLALSRVSLADMFTDVTTLLAQILPADVVLLWEIDPDGEQLVLKSRSGWKGGPVVEAQVAMELNSLEKLVLRSPYPIVVHDLKTESRFKPSSFLQESGAVSGLAVIVGTVQRPYAILEAFSQHHQAFSQNDAQFFHSTANILGLFMDAKRREMVWSQTEQELRKQLFKAQSILSSAPMEQDLHEIKNRLVESRERERLQLAQEIHDVPIQDLYGLMYQLEDLKEIVRDAQGMEILDEFNSTIHRIVNNLRTMCGELRPPSLSPFGLEVAIRDHVERLRSANPDLQIELELMRDQQNLSDSFRLCLFRIYQEAITNVIRHAGATEVHIRFHWDDETVILEVEDNGAGFELPERWVDMVRHECFGLVGIAERVESVKGKLEILSTPDHGTSVRVSVPRR
jgi:signal transduction histidine kinase